MNQTVSQRPVVFLDRDGTLNVEKGYLHNLSDLVLIDGSAEALIALNRAGVAAVLVTNQSGPARGYYPECHVKALNRRLVELLSMHGARLDALYYCPHHVEGTVKELSIACQCRKPMPGMVDRAFVEHPDFDRRQAYVVGDKATDIELALNCKLKGVLVQTGYGKDVEAGTYQWKVEADHTAADIVEAVDWILSDLKLVHSTGAEAAEARAQKDSHLG